MENLNSHTKGFTTTANPHTKIFVVGIKSLLFSLCFMFINVVVYGLVGVPVPFPTPGQNGPPAAAACPSPSNALQDDAAVSAYLCPDFENLGVGTITPDLNSKLHIVQTPEFSIYKPAIKVELGTLNDKGSISAFQANGGTDFSTIQGTYEARIGFSQAFDAAGHMIGGVLGIVRPSIIKSGLTRAFATGTVSIADLDNLTVLSPNVQQTWVGGSYSELTGTILNYPGINNGAIAAMIAIDNIKGVDATTGNRTYAGWFDGRVKIGDQTITLGTVHDDAILIVDGKMVSKKAIVTISNWGDFVFEPGYKADLDAERTSVKINKHLKGAPSAKEVEKNGINVGEMIRTIWIKIEEIFLHLFQFEKDIDGLNQDVVNLKSNDQKLEKRVISLEEENQDLKTENKNLKNQIDLIMKRMDALEKK